MQPSIPHIRLNHSYLLHYRRMKKVLFLLAVLMVYLATALSAQDESFLVNDKFERRFLAQKMTCDKYPRVCRLKGSPGPDCCKTKCVNVSTDTANCGKCGKKCKYSEICCKGECVNPMSNKKHCGSCNNKCKKGSACAYGMCSYA